jgi:polyhydroxyalkanoate synthase
VRPVNGSDLDNFGERLSLVLTDGALGPIRRWIPGPAGVRLATHLATRPRTVSSRVSELVRDLGHVVTGASDIDLKRDRRFAADEWANSPVFRRVAQGYLAAAGTAEKLVGDAQLDYRSDQRVRFLVDNAVHALAPSNNPLLNPVALKAAVDSRGGTLARGARQFANDVRSAPRVPTMVDPTVYKVGVNLATSPGAVIARTDVFELIQYQPTTERVHEVPVLLAPPTINKYYVVDLAPGRSLVEHLVSSGYQTFAISWRNPGAEHADWGIDTYVAAILEAVDVTRETCGIDRAALMGFCSGGILASMAAAHLSVSGRGEQLAGLALAVTLLDLEDAGFASAALSPRVTQAALAASRRRGYLDGCELAEIFAWLRPADLVWNYWVNNYLLGKKPGAFDLLHWNADTTRMTAKLHRDFLLMATDNALATPGRAVALDVPVDLSAVKTDAYVIAGIADHLTPWDSCYRSSGLLGGQSKFVLSTSGHIAAIINPPGNPKASYRVNPDNAADAQEWLDRATVQPGTWWTDYTSWLGDRCGSVKPAPTELGGAAHPPLVPAPGTYVLQS